MVYELKTKPNDADVETERIDFSNINHEIAAGKHEIR
jgi:hypothetical protein